MLVPLFVLRAQSASVKRRKDDIVFLRKIVPGVADGSYGVEVAKIAGLPDKVIRRAKQLLKELEEKGPTRIVVPSRSGFEGQLPMGQTLLKDPVDEDLRARIEALNVDTVTPLEALNILYELKKLTE